MHGMLTSGAGHLLVTTRNHKVKVADMEVQESREIGELYEMVSVGV